MRYFKEPRNRVTVYIEQELHLELKIKAARSGSTVSDWVNDMLAKSLAEESGARQERKRAENEIDEILRSLMEAGKPKSPDPPKLPERFGPFEPPPPTSPPAPPSISVC